MLNNFIRSDKTHFNGLLECYKDAIRKYPEEIKADASEESILEILKMNTVYHIAVQDEIIGWLAFRNIDSFSVLSGMYVKSAFQGTNLSRDMLKYYLKSCSLYEVEHSIMSVPDNAPWSFNFYKKYGYREVNENGFQIISKYLRHHDHANATILYKSLLNF